MTTKSIYATTTDFTSNTYIEGPQLASMTSQLVVPGMGAQNNQSACDRSSLR